MFDGIRNIFILDFKHCFSQIPFLSDSRWGDAVLHWGLRETSHYSTAHTNLSLPVFKSKDHCSAQRNNPIKMAAQCCAAVFTGVPVKLHQLKCREVLLPWPVTLLAVPWSCQSSCAASAEMLLVLCWVCWWCWPWHSIFLVFEQHKLTAVTACAAYSVPFCSWDPSVLYLEISSRLGKKRMWQLPFPETEAAPWLYLLIYLSLKVTLNNSTLMQLQWFCPQAPTFLRASAMTQGASRVRSIGKEAMERKPSLSCTLILCTYQYKREKAPFLHSHFAEENYVLKIKNCIHFYSPL